MMSIDEAARKLHASWKDAHTVSGETITVQKSVAVDWFALDEVLRWYYSKTTKPRRTPRKAKAGQTTRTDRKAATKPPATTTGTKRPARRPAGRRTKP